MFNTNTNYGNQTANLHNYCCPEPLFAGFRPVDLIRSENARAHAVQCIDKRATQVDLALSTSRCVDGTLKPPGELTAQMSQIVSPQQPPTIARIRALASDVSRRQGLVVVVAPHGYGKTVLLDALRAGDTPTLDFAPSGDRPSEPRTVVLADDLDLERHLDRVRALLDDELVDSVVVTGRSQPTRCHPDHLLGMPDLSLDLADVTTLASHQLGEVIGSRVAAIVLPITDGWPLAVRVLLSEIGASTSPIRAAADIPADHHLLEQIMPAWRASLGKDVVAGLSQLSHLEAFNAGMVERLGLEDTIARAAAAGLPIIQVSRHWSRLIEPARRAVAHLSTLETSTLEAAVAELVTHHRPLAALRALMSVGFDDRARMLACDVPVTDLDDENQQELIAVLRRLAGDDLTESPRLALRLARADRNAGNLEDERFTLKQIGGSAALADDPVVAVEALYHRVISGPSLDLESDVDAFESRCPGEGPVRTRWRETRAILWAQQDRDWQLVERACQPLDQAAHDWIEYGDTARAAAALRVLAAAPRRGNKPGGAMDRHLRVHLPRGRSASRDRLGQSAHHR